MFIFLHAARYPPPPAPPVNAYSPPTLRHSNGEDTGQHTEIAMVISSRLLYIPLYAPPLSVSVCSPVSPL
jgi:hypothetical protein